MKKSTATLILIIVLTSCIQEKKTEEKRFTLEANLTNIPDSTLFRLNTLSNKTLDSAYVVNGHLSMKGQLMSQHPEKLILLSTVPEFIYTQLLVENENIIFTADKKDFPWNIDTSGSIHQDEAERFNQIEYQKQKLTRELNLKSNLNKEVASKKAKKITDSLDLVIAELIKKNVNSYAALSRFKYYKTDFSNEELKILYSKLDSKLQETPAAKAIKLQSEFSNPKVGDTYYDYKAITQNGETLSLSEIKNKHILLDFSSFNCYGSQLALPELKKLYKTFGDQLEIVSISTDIDKSQWQNHVKRDSILWPYIWDGKGDYNEGYVMYWANGTPYYILISPDKIILEKWWGYGKGIFNEKVANYLDQN